MYWGNREDARDLPGRLDQERRQVRAQRRRQLHLRRPQRRHAQGQRHLRLALRGGGHAGAAPGGAGGGRDRRARRRRPDQDQGLRGAQGRRQATEAELKAFVKDKLAPYKYPRQIEFVAELPKTATGKIQRFKLRELESAGP
jgi:acyl-CoA synthetase (AMP-forming)/AMP-acid ligase II